MRYEMDRKLYEYMRAGFDSRNPPQVNLEQDLSEKLTDIMYMY